MSPIEVSPMDRIWILMTPYYHFLMLILAAIVIWQLACIKRKLSKLHPKDRE